MDLKEIHQRFLYRIWFNKIELTNNKIIIYIVNYEYFEPKVVERIMSQYPYEYEIKILTYYEYEQSKLMERGIDRKS